MSKQEKYQIDTDFPIERLEGTQRIILDLALSTRKPQNEKERELLKEIKEIENKGYMIDFPFEQNMLAKYQPLINLKTEIKVYDLV